MTKKIKTYVLMLSEVFPKGHPKSGQPTGFREKLLSGEKIHTIRANAKLWESRIEEVRKGVAVLSVRQWSGKPYGKGTRQVEIVRLTSADGVGTQQVRLNASVFDDVITDGGWVVGKAWDTIAAHDGLALQDFFDWFAGYNHTDPLVIIHFTSFRY